MIFMSLLMMRSKSYREPGLKSHLMRTGEKNDQILNCLFLALTISSTLAQII